MIIGDLFNNNFEGTVYYVSNSGSDSNNGITISTPFATLTKVNSLSLNPGDQVLFQCGGTWYGSLTINYSGTNGKNIIFGCYGTGVLPIITGFTTVSGWSQLGDIWTSTSSVSTLTTCNMVTIGGVNIPMGRYPNASSTVGTLSNSGYLNIDSVTSTSITSSGLSSSPNLTGGTIVYRSGYYTMGYAPITSQSGTTLNFTTYTPNLPAIDYGFFVQNCLSTLDTQNEWYYNASTGEISVYSTSQPVNVQIASIANLFNFGTYNGGSWSAANYITIQNLNFVGCNSDAIWGKPTLNGGYQITGVLIQNCSFNFCGNLAIYLENTVGITVINNTINNCNGGAIDLGYSKNYVNVIGNTISNIGMNPGMGPLFSAIQCGGSYTNTPITIKYNNIQYVAHNAITSGNDVTLVQYNFINSFCNTMCDGAGIYGMSDGTIDHNIIINGIGNPLGTPTANGYPSAGIYLDNDSTNSVVSNNFIANTINAGIFLNGPVSYIQVLNNIAYNSTRFVFYANGSWYNNASLAEYITVTGNQFIAAAEYNTGVASSYQKAFNFYFGDTNTFTSGSMTAYVLNHNYYVRPIDQTNALQYDSSVGTQYYPTFAQWQTLTGQDANSVGSSPEVLSSLSDMTFYYNFSNTTLVQSLSYPCMDVIGNVYTTSINILPYTGVVLLKDYSL